MTPEEITQCLARMSNPYTASDPDDAARALARLIREARSAVSPLRQRAEARLYPREGRTLGRALLRVQHAPADELRLLVMRVVDILWGEGRGDSVREPRRLDFEKEWDCPNLLSAIANLIQESSFDPFEGRGK